MDDIARKTALSTIAVRKIVTYSEERYMEGGRELERPLNRAVACAVLRNPWAGMGYIDDLWIERNRVGEVLSRELATRLVDIMGGADQIKGFGKCAIVGTNGETEHGAAMLHGPCFGPNIRTLFEATSGISSTECRSSPGGRVSIPMNHKSVRATRAYYQAIDFTIHDAPHPDELAVALAVTGGPRPLARIGELETDKERLP